MPDGDDVVLTDAETGTLFFSSVLPRETRIRDLFGHKIRMWTDYGIKGIDSFPIYDSYMR